MGIRAEKAAARAEKAAQASTKNTKQPCTLNRLLELCKGCESHRDPWIGEVNNAAMIKTVCALKARKDVTYQKDLFNDFIQGGDTCVIVNGLCPNIVNLMLEGR